MSEVPQDSALIMSIGSWRPKSLGAPSVLALAQPWRIAILAVVVLFHLLAFRWLTQAKHAEDGREADSGVLIVNFIDRAPEVDAPELPTTTPRKQRSTASSEPTGDNRGNPERPISTVGSREISSAPATDGALQLYNRDGSLRTPADMLDQIDRAMGDKRVFSYQIPRMDDARKIFYRNLALPVESTRFEQYWRPDQDLLTDILTRLVEATTKEISIPVPGNPGSKMVCRISVLAFGGGCGVLTNGSDYVGPLDDPETLNPEEDRQCQAWWEQIIGAKTQELWRKTRALYEAQCRKPLARLPSG